MKQWFSHSVECLKRHALIVVGFALFCTILRLPYFGNIISTELADAHSFRGILDASILALSVVACITGKRVNLEEDATALASTALFTVGVGIFTAAQHVVDFPIWAGAAGALCCACGFMLLCWLWMGALSGIPRNDLLPAALFAFTASLVVGFADALSGPLKTLVNLAIPLASCYCAARAKLSGKSQPETTSAKGASHIVLLSVVGIAVEVLCCSLLRGTWMTGGIGYTTADGLRTLSYLVSAGFGIAFFLVAVFAERLEKGLALISIVSLALLILLILALALFGRTFFGSFTTSLYSTLLVTLFVALASAAQNGSIAHLASAGIFSFVFAIISLASYTLIPHLFLYDSGRSAAYVMPVALAASLIAAIGMCVIIGLRLREQVKIIRNTLGDANGDQVWESIAMPQAIIANPIIISPEEALDAAIAQATLRYKLTERETQIVKLFAQGRTIKQTAAELYLAPSTVQGYTKSIYAKLGVHGKDEIRDLLESLVQ